MSTLVITGREVYLGSIRYSCEAHTAAFAYGAEMHDDTTLCDSTRSNKAGLFTVGFSMEGFYNPDVTDEALFNSLSVSDVPLSISADSSAVGSVGYTLKVTNGSYTPVSGSVGDIAPFTIDAQSSHKLIRGVVGANQTGAAATGAESSANIGAISATQKLYAALHVVDSSGSGDQTLDVVIESDATDAFGGGETTRLTFAQATTSALSEWVEVTGPITDEYFRVKYTIGGTGSPSFDFFVVFGKQ